MATAGCSMRHLVKRENRSIIFQGFAPCQALTVVLFRPDVLVGQPCFCRPAYGLRCIDSGVASRGGRARKGGAPKGAGPEAFASGPAVGDALLLRVSGPRNPFSLRSYMAYSRSMGPSGFAVASVWMGDAAFAGGCWVAGAACTGAACAGVGCAGVAACWMGALAGWP